jgi:hypothetical protein
LSSRCDCSGFSGFSGFVVGFFIPSSGRVVLVYSGCVLWWFLLVLVSPSGFLGFANMMVFSPETPQTPTRLVCRADVCDDHSEEDVICCLGSLSIHLARLCWLSRFGASFIRVRLILGFAIRESLLAPRTRQPRSEMAWIDHFVLASMRQTMQGSYVMEDVQGETRHSGT